MSNLSASKLELAQRCLGAFTLPWKDSPNEWSKGGNERHAEDESAIGAGDIPEAYTSRWPNYTWRAEVAFSYDVATGEGRELGAGIGRAYGSGGPFTVFGTADVIGRGPNGELVVVDKKSFEETTKAADNPQVGFLARAATAAYGLDACDVAINHELTGLDVAMLDVFDLDVTAHAVRQVLIDVVKAQGDSRSGLEVPFNTGRHCRWCNAFESCPKQGELVQLVKREDAALERAESVMPVLDDANAPDVYALWKRIGILHKRIGQSLYAKAADHSIAIGGGKFFGKQVKQGNREYDADLVHAVVTEKFTRDIADACVERVTSQAKIEATLKDVVAKGSLAATKKAVLDEVEKRGGMTRETKESIVEFVPQLKAVNE